ncbi:MAG: hypothetical protein QME79_13065, partial [Bacillota bacterium]|nr:hypothetical protein [Bacillota bacterium]
MNLRHLIELLRHQGTDVEVAGDLGALDQEVLAVTSRVAEAGPRVVLVVEPVADPLAVREALRRGVAAVVTEEPLVSPVPVLRVRRAREAFRHLLAAFYGTPTQQLLLWGVTGPGQTSVAFLLHRCLAAHGLRSGLWADVLGAGTRCGAGRGTGFPASLLLFLRNLTERGGQAAVLSLCREDLTACAASGLALQGLIALGRPSSRLPARLVAARSLLVPAGWRPPPGAGPFFTFGPGPEADLRYRRPAGRPAPPEGHPSRPRPLPWFQELEFAAGSHLVPPGAEPRPLPATFRARRREPRPEG